MSRFEGEETWGFGSGGSPVRAEMVQLFLHHEPRKDKKQNVPRSNGLREFDCFKSSARQLPLLVDRVPITSCPVQGFGHVESMLTPMQEFRG